MKLVPPLLLFCGSAYAQGREADKVQEYLRLAQATLQNPITHAELREAVLSEGGIAAIAGLFQKSIAESLTVGGKVVTPELGGEATLAGGRLTLVEYPDPTHSVIRRVVELRDDSRALLDFLTQSGEGQNVLKTTGGLHALLYQMSRSAPGKATAQQRTLLDQVVLGAVSIHFKTWNVDPETQLEVIRKSGWQGRYVGFWHIHPPRLNERGLSEGIEPSASDMTNAMEKGQFVTIVFQPDGFDFYDLSPLGVARRVDLSLARAISHRSPEWGPTFRDLFRTRK